MRAAAAAAVVSRAARGSTREPDDLVAAVRGELGAIEPARACCRAAERAGLGAAGRGQAHTPVTARLAVRLGPEPGTSAPFDWDAAPEHCRVAYLRGLFLARGSLSLAGSRTHLEFVVPAPDAPLLARRLGEMGVPGSWRVRRGRGVVTWKSLDHVTRFLRAIGAGASLLELEARGVARALSSDLNRVFNAEAANLERAVRAASRQLEAIALLEADGRLGRESEVVRRVARARREAPDATFGELALGLGLTRSRVQRALQRLERLARQQGP